MTDASTTADLIGWLREQVENDVREGRMEGAGPGGGLIVISGVYLLIKSLTVYRKASHA